MSLKINPWEIIDYIKRILQRLDDLEQAVALIVGVGEMVIEPRANDPNKIVDLPNPPVVEPPPPIAGTPTKPRKPRRKPKPQIN